MALTDGFDPFAPALQYRDATEPGVSADIEKILSGTDTPKPVMAEAVDDEIELLCGVTIGGDLVRTAQVRQLMGSDEEEMARAAASGRPDRMLNTLLLAGVVRVGKHPVTDGVLNRMLVGDRDLLTLQIRRATFGDLVEFEKYQCPGCSSTFALSVDLREVEFRSAEEPGKTDFEVELRGGRRARVRHATGADQIALVTSAKDSKLTLPEQETVLLSRVVLALDAGDGVWAEVSANPAHARDSLSMADRRAIIRAMDELRPGPRLDAFPVTCPDCAHTDSIALSVEALFRG